MRAIVFVLSFLLSFHFSYSTDSKKITKKLLKQEKSEIDPDAGSEFLYLEKKIYFDYNNGAQIITEYHKQIKFYGNSNQDLRHGTEEIYLYEGLTERESITNIKAVTYNLVNDKIEKTKLDRSQIFKDQYRENLDKISFTLPQLRKGSIIEISYTISSPYYTNIPDLQYQFDIPVKEFLGELTVPGNISIGRIKKGFEESNVDFKEFYDYNTNTNADKFIYTANNVNALKREKWVDNIDNYLSSIVFEFKAIKYASGKIKNFSSSWGAIAKTIADHEDYDRNIYKTSIFQDDLKLALEGINDTKEKMYKVLDFAKSRISWNKKYGKYFQKGIRKAYKDKSGNVADINLSLVAMLRTAGIEACPVVLTTRNYTRPLFPSLNRLNYVVAFVQIGYQSYYLDATDIYSEPNVLPKRVYNNFGLYIDNNKKVWKKLIVDEPHPSVNFAFTNIELLNNGKIAGSIKQQKENHYAYFTRKSYFNKSEEEFLKDQESKYGSLKISDYQINNLDSIGKITEEFNFTQDSYYSKLDNEIYINPIVAERTTTSPFKANNRKLPVDFFSPYRDKNIINVKIPEGYQIKSLPTSQKIKLGDIGKFDYIVSKSNDHVMIMVHNEMKESRIIPEDYAKLQQFFDKIIEIEKQQIVFSKI